MRKDENRLIIAVLAFWALFMFMVSYIVIRASAPKPPESPSVKPIETPKFYPCNTNKCP